MNSIANIALRQAFLKPKLPNFLPQICMGSNLIAHTDGIFRQGRLKQKYMKKAPIIQTKENGEIQIEGVSNKQYPQVAPWTQPDYMFRGNPGEDEEFYNPAFKSFIFFVCLRYTFLIHMSHCLDLDLIEQKTRRYF